MKFVQSLFDSSDDIGKTLLRAYLVRRGHVITDNENRYGIDLFSEKNDKVYRWEVEMKSLRPWTSREDFEFDTVSFLRRKEKWKNELFWYVIICRETGAALMCSSDIIFQEKYKQFLKIKTNYRQGTDIFYRVPKELCIFVPPEEFYEPE
jgi:ABC-type oligopeptide transport system ATPase subunit